MVPVNRRNTIPISMKHNGYSATIPYIIIFCFSGVLIFSINEFTIIPEEKVINPQIITNGIMITIGIKPRKAIINEPKLAKADSKNNLLLRESAEFLKFSIF